MAGLFGLKILLFWTGTITLVNCQVPSAGSSPLPSNTPHTVAPSVTSLSSSSSSPSNMAATSAMSLTSARTVAATSAMSPTSPRTMAATSAMSPTSPRTMAATSAMSPTSSITESTKRSQTPTQSPIDSAATSPTNTPLTPTTVSSNKTADPQTNITSNKLLPPNNQSNTTVVTPDTVTPSKAQTTSQPAQPESTTPPSPQCSYTVSPIKFGFKIDIMNSPSGSYVLTLTEKVSGIVLNELLLHSNQTPPRDITPLKPCTEYSHSLVFDGTNTKCNPVGNITVRTSEMKENDIEDGNCTSMPWHVCYSSKWDISSSVSASNNVKAQQCPEDPSVFCIKPGNNSICTNLTTTFRSGNCSSFKRIRDISIDYFEIEHTPPNRLPVQDIYHTPFPPNCSNLTIEYNCQDNDDPSNKAVTPRDLEPFTEYSCTGQINQNNQTIKTTTVPKFTINCDLKVKPRVMKSTDTSIKLDWTPYSDDCKVDYLNKFGKLTYECHCRGQGYSLRSSSSPSSSNQCSVDGLKPYTDYTCTVQPSYNGTPFGTSSTANERTAIGTPEKVTGVSVSHPQHNEITVKCEHSRIFNGPEGQYAATLSYDGNTVTRTNYSGCYFTFQDLSYSTTYTLKVRAVNSKHGGTEWTEKVTTNYNDKAVIGFLIFLIILTSVALLLVVYKIFILKQTRSGDTSESMKLIGDEETLMTVDPITADSLLDSYKMKLADEGRLFLAEFQSIPRIYSRYSVKEAKKLCNASKNRYVDILPYDHNRVHLTTGNGEPGSDYINASFIDGYKEPKKYIAAQGPKEETVVDFWRMVWEQQSSIIVMVTRCEEGNRVKCAQYWPIEIQEANIYEDFVVKLMSEDEFPNYIIRRISLINKRDKGSEREVTHIQFISWPDHGVPGEPHLLLKLRRRVNSFKNLFSGPIVVHCSAGVGRTGTYIGIDAMMESLDAEGSVDIYKYVVHLRKQRCLMVQVEAQYILIHQALLEHNQFGETEIPLPELHSALSTLKQKSLDSEDSLMKEEFERLPTFKNWRTYNTGSTEENKKKNRSSSAIPYDYNRVLLKLDEGRSHDSDPDDDEDEEEESSDEEDEESTKYINASHIDGYWGPRFFIAAQTPLPDTMADFWSMVYQKKAHAIVMLSECNEGEEDSDCIYWGKDKKVFGDFEVEVASTEIAPVFTTRNMLLRHVKRKESRTIKHFQFLKWGNNELPEKTQNLTDLIKEVKHNGKSQKSNPIVVHCNNGSARTGVFCALWNVLDSAESEKLVDVFQVTKTLRKERQGILSSLEQYQFLYSALEGVFPVQNGNVKAAQSPAADSIQIVNETKATAAATEQPSEEKPEQPASTTNNSQQGEAESTPNGVEGGTEDKKEEAEKVPTETKPPEETSNGPTVTVEV